MLRGPSIALARILGVVVLLLAAALPGTAQASAGSRPGHRVTTTFTAHVLGGRDTEGPAEEPGCYGSQSTEITVSGRPSDWHLRLHQSDYLSCSSCEYTTDADEDLGPGEFWMSRSLKHARLDADVTLRFGCPEGGSAPAHISAVWSGRGKVTTTVSTSPQAGPRTRTVTKTRPATFGISAGSTFEWPADQPPRAYLRSERTCQR